MKLIKRILAHFGYHKAMPIIDETIEFENLDFIKGAVDLNKRMLNEEKRRSTLWTDKLLYEDIFVLIKKYFDGQNDDLKKRVIELESELKRERLENKRNELQIQKLENQIKEVELV